MPQTLLFGTLLFSDSMARPEHLDSASVDWAYPIPTTNKPNTIQNTRSVRKCYRSKRISLAGLNATGVPCLNATVFLHNSDKLVPGAVRVYLWRKKQSVEYLGAMTGSSWSEYAPRKYAHVSTSNTPLTSSVSFITGKEYQIDWTVTIAPNHGSVDISFGGVAVMCANPSGIVSNKITMSGSARITPTTTAPLIVTPHDDPYTGSTFNGNVSFSVTDPYDVRPLAVSNEEFMDVVCKTRTVTKGISIASAQVNALFDSMQVVVMQPCSGVSVYVGPEPENPGPLVGPVSN